MTAASSFTSICILLLIHPDLGIIVIALVHGTTTDDLLFLAASCQTLHRLPLADQIVTKHGICVEVAYLGSLQSGAISEADMLDTVGAALTPIVELFACGTRPHAGIPFSIDPA